MTDTNEKVKGEELKTSEDTAQSSGTAGYVGSLSWKKETPNEQGYWWWWNEDEDSAPIPVMIFVSHTRLPRYFATVGQHGWNRPQWVDDMGGHWMRLLEPEVPIL